MSIKPEKTPLPIDDLLRDIVGELRDSPNAVIVAPPGAGKTTRIPPALAEEKAILGNGSIVMLQPRRVAARAAAVRIAEENGWILGREVGYQIRFENRTSPQTRIRVLTEGILTRRIQSDPFLEGIGCVILDEFHERSIYTDVSLALLREIQTTVRPDLRIVVMSATMNPEPIAYFLDGAKVFISEGRLYPVDLDYLSRPDQRPIWEKTTEAVKRIASASDGHILVFLPGMGEIRRVEERIGSLNLETHILHSSVPAEAQDRALRPSDKRKLILATNIAETSITIDGVRTVIDSGYARVLVNDVRLGIDKLELHRISRASATQRAGRAGRTGAGRCLRLWTRTDDAILEDEQSPEIHRIDLAGTLLALHRYGVRDPMDFAWYESPPPESLEGASRLLRMLGATNLDGTLTGLGGKLADMPVHPRLARVVMAGARAGVMGDAATAAAILSERDILARKPGRRSSHPRWESLSDVLDRIDMVEGLESAPNLDRGAIRNVIRVREQLVRLVKDIRTSIDNDDERSDAIRRALLQGYPDRVTVRRSNDASRGLMVGGRGVVLDAECTVRKASLFLSLDVRDQSGSTEARVATASAIEENWLEEDFPHLLEEQDELFFDEQRERVMNRHVVRFAGLAVQEQISGTTENEEQAAKILADHLAARATEIFGKEEAAAKFLNRLVFVSTHAPDAGLPSIDEEHLVDLLTTACAGCTSIADIQRRGLRTVLENAFTWKQRQTLDRLAPEVLEVPSGSRIRLVYTDDGSPPVLAARLQELFGLAETPRIADGRLPVVIHLLGPNFRPVQVTTDLRNFWNETYHEVRKELRARYPKHPWPEDPWSAEAVAVGRRRRK